MLKQFFPSKEIIRWTYLHMKKRIPAIVLLTVCRVITTCLGIVFSLVTKNVINGAATGNDDLFIKNCIYLVIVIAIQILLSSLALHIQEKLLYECDRDFKTELLHRILCSDYAQSSKYHSGDLLHRMNSDASNLYQAVLSICTAAVSLVVGLVTAACVLAALDPGFTLFIIPVCVILAAATVLAQRNMKSYQKETSAKSAKLSGFMQEVMEKLLIVQGLDIPNNIEHKANEYMKDKIDSQRKMKNVYLVMNLGSSILGYAGSFITLVWCAGSVLNGNMDYGTLIAMTSLVAQLQGPLLTLPAILPKFATITASGERLMEIDALKCTEELINEDSMKLYSRLKKIDFRKLVFSYTGKSDEIKTVLQNASFDIDAEGMTVVTGPSGIGKSTILKLILGIYVPDSGNIDLILNDNSKVAVNRSVRNLFAYAPQGNLVLSGTIRENLLVTNPSATEDELKEAVYVSAMDDYVDSLPMGLDTNLGENGAGLSEGQIQRINIARAILKGSPILLLDEVTSSLDVDTEKKVLERIRALPNRTCIVVTHRPAALELADYELKVSETGCITERLK